jgi:glycine cleavage system protein P-like pyridoxal-binding family
MLAFFGLTNLSFDVFNLNLHEGFCIDGA